MRTSQGVPSSTAFVVSDVEGRHDATVIGPRLGHPLSGILRDRGNLDAAGRHVGDDVDERVGHEDVMDELTAPPADAREPLKRAYRDTGYKRGRSGRFLFDHTYKRWCSWC